MQLDVWMLKKSKCLADGITNTDRLRGGKVGMEKLQIQKEKGAQKAQPSRR